MKKVGKKFTAKRKLQILKDWDGTSAGAERTARRFSCCSASIWIWNAALKNLPANATEEDKLKALENKSSRPHHFRNPHTKNELDAIQGFLDEYPGISRLELFRRLRTEKAYSRSIRTMYRVVRKLNVMHPVELQKYIPEPYKTPAMLGVKWQIDVKYVPANCIASELSAKYIKLGNSKGLRFYQYTCIDECTRERFVYAYDSFGKCETLDFIQRCIVFFGYIPLIVQTDNGGEFTNINKNIRNVHEFTLFLNGLGIEHKLIRPATPRHNGKVERSHRTDNECFYKHNIFNSLNDLRSKMKIWLIRYNTKRPSAPLDYLTPDEKREYLLVKLRQENITEFEDKQFSIRFIKADREKAFVA